VGYFSYCLRRLPSAYTKLDTNRLTLAHFAIHALSLLGVWDNIDTQGALGLDREGIIEWIYGLQVVSSNDELVGGPNIHEAYVGFKGGSFLGGGPFATINETDEWKKFNQGHVAMTYTALCSLRTLGDDLSRIDKKGIIKALSHLQLSDGSFQCVAVGSEHDMRFLYCACCISYMLDDWSGVDKDRAVTYIQSCRSYDGAVALVPGNEGHGGSTFCAIASLALMQRLDEVLDDEWRSELTHWCVQRQLGGLQGRPNKLEDTCYSYWIGGTLHLLGRFDLMDHEALRRFVMQCQTSMGGFSKVIGAFPDVLHAYYSLAYLSLSQEHVHVNPEDTLKDLDCLLGIGKDTAEHFPLSTSL
jgi:geranylgeranyl transferase type-1 subunit beta